MNIAVLDIGSNTTKILIAAKNKAGKLESVAEKSYPCRLGTALSQDRPVLSVVLMWLYMRPRKASQRIRLMLS